MNKKILIVDDSPLDLKILTEVLKNSSDTFQILSARDGKEAYDISIEAFPDVILMDWELPKISGIEVATKIKLNELTKDIPIIIISGVQINSESLLIAFNAGAIDFLEKPVDKIELLARINSALKLSESLKNVRKKNKQILNSKRFLQNIIDTFPNPFVFYNSDGKILGCNKEFEIISNKKLNQIINRNIYHLLPRSIAGSFFNDDLNLLDNNITEKNEIDFDKGNEIRHFIISKAKYEDTNDDLIICLFSDITEFKKTQSALILEQKKKLTSTLMRLIQFNEFSSKILGELNKLEKTSTIEGKKVVHSIINKIQSMSDEKNWEEFDLHFNKVQEEFYERLRLENSNITPNELKLCAFLRLNMTSKEIASMIHQNPQSIDVARYRLRKKLGLNDKENLIIFLQKI